MLRDVADELELHESTISRATGNKYMSTPRGIFEFKHFFPRELSTESGGTCSAAAVRALLKEMIAKESSSDPLSDVRLARMLADQGVIVARRTVAKYRHLMKVPPAELRRGLSRRYALHVGKNALRISKGVFYRQPEFRWVRLRATIADTSAPSRNTAAE